MKSYSKKNTLVDLNEVKASGAMGTGYSFRPARTGIANNFHRPQLIKLRTEGKL